MKTRKYKDNLQRKNFAQNESKLFLTQYFKKKQKMTSGYDDRVPSAPHGAPKKAPYQTAGGSATLADYKKWSSFKYPKSLSTFFLERPSLKSTYLLISLKDHANASKDTLSKAGHQGKVISNSNLIKIAIKDLAFKMCYSKKIKQQQNKTRIRGRCIQSNRPRSVSRLLCLSRIRTRTLALEGKITGCTRST